MSPGPSVGETRRIVALEGLRPTIPCLWFTMKHFRHGTHGWNQKLESRLTALNHSLQNVDEEIVDRKIVNRKTVNRKISSFNLLSNTLRRENEYQIFLATIKIN